MTTKPADSFLRRGVLGAPRRRSPAETVDATSEVARAIGHVSVEGSSIISDPKDQNNARVLPAGEIHAPVATKGVIYEHANIPDPHVPGGVLGNAHHQNS